MNFRANIAWNVYLFGKQIDRVYFTPDCDKEYVKTSLINHDGYHHQITVVNG